MFKLFMILILILTYSCSQMTILPSGDSKSANNSAATTNFTPDNKNYYVSMDIGMYKQGSAKTPANSKTVIIMQKFNADSSGDPSGTIRNCKLFLDSSGIILDVHSNTDYNYTVDKTSTNWNITANANSKATSTGSKNYSEIYDSTSDSISYNSGDVKSYLAGQNFKVTSDIGALNIKGDDAPTNLSDLDTLCDNANQGGSDDPIVNANISIGDAGKYDQLVYLVGDSMNFTAYSDELNSNTYGGVTGSSSKIDGLKPFNIPVSITPANAPLSTFKFKNITTGINSPFCNAISKSLAFSVDKTSIKINPIDLTNLQLSQNFSTAIQCQFSITNGQQFILVFNKSAADWCSQAQIFFQQSDTINGLQKNYNDAKTSYDDTNKLLTISNNKSAEFAKQSNSKSADIDKLKDTLKTDSTNPQYTNLLNQIALINRQIDGFNSVLANANQDKNFYCSLGGLNITKCSAAQDAINRYTYEVKEANFNLANFQSNIIPLQAKIDTDNANITKAQGELDTINQSILQNQTNINSYKQSLVSLKSAMDKSQSDLNTYISSHPNKSNGISSTIYSILADKTKCEFVQNITSIDFSNITNPDLSIISGFRNLSKITLPAGFKIDPQLYAILKSHTQLQNNN